MIGLKTCRNVGAIYCLSFSLITFPGSRLENKLIKLFTTQSFTHGFKFSTLPGYSGFQRITLRQRWRKRLYPMRLHKMGKKERKKETSHCKRSRRGGGFPTMHALFVLLTPNAKSDLNNKVIGFKFQFTQMDRFNRRWMSIKIQFSKCLFASYTGSSKF